MQGIQKITTGAGSVKNLTQVFEEKNESTMDTMKQSRGGEQQPHASSHWKPPAWHDGPWKIREPTIEPGFLQDHIFVYYREFCNHEVA